MNASVKYYLYNTTCWMSTWSPRKYLCSASRAAPSLPASPLIAGRSQKLTVVPAHVSPGDYISFFRRNLKSQYPKSPFSFLVTNFISLPLFSILLFTALFSAFLISARTPSSGSFYVRTLSAAIQCFLSPPSIPFSCCHSFPSSISLPPSPPSDIHGSSLPRRPRLFPAKCITLA